MMTILKTSMMKYKKKYNEIQMVVLLFYRKYIYVGNTILALEKDLGRDDVSLSHIIL
jgi:hypothetical protein